MHEQSNGLCTACYWLCPAANVYMYVYNNTVCAASLTAVHSPHHADNTTSVRDAVLQGLDVVIEAGGPLLVRVIDHVTHQPSSLPLTQIQVEA